MKTKVCSKCKVEKPINTYYKDSRKTLGIRSYCKDCEKKRYLAWREKNRSEYNNYAAAWRAKNPEKQYATEIKRRYGITIEAYNEMLAKQGNRCKICNHEHNPKLKKQGRLFVDHDHKTNKTRALLCHNCNSGLGHFRDNKEFLAAAIKYLDEQD